MSDTLHTFTSKSHQALKDFIAQSRDLFLFSDNSHNPIEYTSSSWDLSGHITVPHPRANTKLHIPGDKLFQDVIKSVIGQELWADRKNKKSMAVYAKFALAGRRLYEASQHDDTHLDPTRLQREHFTNALILAGKNRDTPGALTKIAFYLSSHGICPDLEGFKLSKIAGNQHTSRINKVADRKPINDDIAFAIADAFHKAKTPRDQIISSILALLTCAPARLTEVLLLPVDAELIEAPGDTFCSPDTPFNEDTRFHYGLRWFPVKGGTPTIKFIPKEMAPVAQEAIKRLKAHTQTARDTASWMMANPGEMPLPENLDHVRKTRTLTHKDLTQLYGKNAIARARERGCIKTAYDSYCFNTLEEGWKSFFPDGWPYLNKDHHIRYDNALCITYLFAFTPNAGTDTTVVQGISATAIQKDLNSQNGLFNRLDVKLPDGTVPRFTTHQIRHYLNTIAQQANIPQAHIALWSGRKNIMQNTAYDHTDRDALVDSILRDTNPDETTVPVIVDDADSTIKSSFLKQNITSTPIGFCLGDLRFSPCDKAGACLDCTRLVCVAEPGPKRDAIIRDIERKRHSLENFKKAESEGKRTNPRAKMAAEKAVEHGQKLLAAIDNPDNAGKLIKNTTITTLPGFSHDKRLATSQTPSLKGNHHE